MKEIEQLFKKKLKHESEAFLQLEQEGLEMEQQFDKQIKAIKDKNEEAIWKLFNEFKQNLEKVEVEFVDSKQTANSLKLYYDEKLRKQEDEHEFEVIEVEESHKRCKKDKESEMNKLVTEQTEQLAALERAKQKRGERE